MDDRKLNHFLVVVIVLAIAVVLAFVEVIRADPLPELIPALVPPVQTIEVQVTAEVRREPVRKLTKKVKQIIGYQPGACPTCPPVAVWGEVEVPLSPDEIKANDLVDKFAAATLTDEEVLEAKAAGLKDAVREVIGQRYSYATCGMICFSHGSQLYLMFKDGHEELAPAEQQPASGGAGWGGGQKFYPIRVWKNWR